MHWQHPQTAYRKNDARKGDAYEGCDKKKEVDFYVTE